MGRYQRMEVSAYLDFFNSAENVQFGNFWCVLNGIACFFHLMWRFCGCVLCVCVWVCVRELTISFQCKNTLLYFVGYGNKRCNVCSFFALVCLCWGGLTTRGQQNILNSIQRHICSLHRLNIYTLKIRNIIKLPQHFGHDITFIWFHFRRIASVIRYYPWLSKYFDRGIPLKIVWTIWSAIWGIPISKYYLTCCR